MSRFSQLIQRASRLPRQRSGPCTLLAVAYLASALLLGAGCAGSNQESTEAGTDFRPIPAKLVQQPITEPPIERAADMASSDFVKENDLVIGVALNGDYRAYPLNQMTGPKQEVINDYLGDRPILVTW